MGAKKQYTDPTYYERKLERVMERFEVEEFNFNYDRWGCWIEFRIKSQLHRFDHSVENARAKGIELRYGSDAFAQVVLALEDLARMVERGIYDLPTWVAGMRYLPPPVEVPQHFLALGFEQIPSGAEEVKTRYRNLSKTHHPDMGGSEEAFKVLHNNAEMCMQHFGRSLGPPNEGGSD